MQIVCGVGAGLFRLFMGWGRVYSDCLLVTESMMNPPLQIWVLRSQIRFFGVIGGVGAGLCRLFVGDRINGEPAPTNLGFTIANSWIIHFYYLNLNLFYYDCKNFYSGAFHLFPTYTDC